MVDEPYGPFVPAPTKAAIEDEVIMVVSG